MNSSKQKIKVYFRLDCGGLIGFGHLSRCLSVADAIADACCEPIFIIRKRVSLQSLPLRYPIIWLPEAEDVTKRDIHQWIVISEQNELQDFIQLTLPVGLVLLDHYALGVEWQKGVRMQGHRLALFQDLMDENFEADFLINYQVGADDLYLDAKKNYPQTQFLLGPSFSPLQKEYSKLHERKKALNHSDEIVGVYLGGVPTSDCLKVASAIREIPFFKEKHIDWVISPQNSAEAIRSCLPGCSVTFYMNLPSLLPIYQKAQLFIGACGVSYLERACLGLWQLNFLVADNQFEAVEYLRRNSLSFILGDLRTMDTSHIAISLRRAIHQDAIDVQQVIDNSFDLIDGLGAERIREVLL